MVPKCDSETGEQVFRLLLEWRREALEESEPASFSRLHELVGIPVDTMESALAGPPLVTRRVTRAHRHVLRSRTKLV